MRNIILAITAVVSLAAAPLLAASSANAESHKWCAVLNMGDASANCGFDTVEQCRITVSGIGGFCALNRFYEEPGRMSSKPARMRHPG